MARLTDPPPPRSPFLPPPGPPQLPPAPPALTQRGWAALTLSVLSLLTMMLMANIQRGVYVAAVALVVAIVALILSFTTMSAARRARTRRPRGALPGAVLGVIAFLFTGFAFAGFLMFHTQLDQYANCMSAANTNATQQVCQTQLDNSVGNEIGILGGS